MEEVEAEPLVTGIVQLETGILLGTAGKRGRLDWVNVDILVDDADSGNATGFSVNNDDFERGHR